MSTTHRFGIVTLAVVATGLALTGCSSSQHTSTADSAQPATTTSPTSSATESPAPTETSSNPVASQCLNSDQAFAIVQAANNANTALDTEHGFACADGWAYVNFHDLSHGNHSTAMLQYVNGSWVIGDRTVACGDSGQPAAAPKVITDYGCGN